MTELMTNTAVILRAALMSGRRAERNEGEPGRSSPLYDGGPLDANRGVRSVIDSSSSLIVCKVNTEVALGECWFTGCCGGMIYRCEKEVDCA